MGKHLNRYLTLSLSICVCVYTHTHTHTHTRIYIHIYVYTHTYIGFPGGSVVKNLTAMQETLVWSLGWEDPLEEGMATHSNIPAWRIPRIEEPGRLQSIVHRVGHDWSDQAAVTALINSYLLNEKWDDAKHHMSLKKEKKVKLLSRIRLFATPWTVAYQAPPSMGFSRQEYWSGLPFPSPGDVPDPRFEPESPTV